MFAAKYLQIDTKTNVLVFILVGTQKDSVWGQCDVFLPKIACCVLQTAARERDSDAAGEADVE